LIWITFDYAVLQKYMLSITIVSQKGSCFECPLLVMGHGFDGSNGLGRIFSVL